MRQKDLPLTDKSDEAMNSTNKFICIHGHFYQPPRENAWLEVVESEDSAAPFANWNERITYECYAPNTAARILDHHNRITNIVNNYARISFNMGPTLLSWLERTNPVTYREILRADRISRVRFGGHGSALAQVYNHLIMPLANRRDKETQIIWGIRDFEHRFQRPPEGMWLAETAVDTETLELLAEHGIRFTILAPRQAKAFRKRGSERWSPTDNGSIDPRRPYRCDLPSGQSINLFFYDGGIAQSVAFEGLLNNGEAFANRILGSFSDDNEPELAHIATDGESYGHHHHYGEMALAACLKHIDESGQATLVNYGEYLEHFPPKYEVQIHEDSSWSCVHGVERWRADCGCNSGGHPGWNQKWRAPLRDTLDWLRDTLAPLFERETGLWLSDPWATRNRYIQLILDRDPDEVEGFLLEETGQIPGQREKTKLLRLLEMQRHCMLMYTSCGWFFDEVSGIETNQILQYAHRAIAYAAQVSDLQLHQAFEERLEQIPSNVFHHAAASYRRFVLPKSVDLERVGMHYAVSSLFEKYPEELAFFNYLARTESFERFKAGNHRLAYGRTRVRSIITHSEKHFSFAVLYLGQQNMLGCISTNMAEAPFSAMVAALTRAFHQNDLGEVISLMQHHFQKPSFSIKHLFQDEKRKILHAIAEKSLSRAELAFREIYNDTYQLMLGMKQNQIPIPDVYLSAVGHVINQELVNALHHSPPSNDNLQQLAEEKKRWGVRFQDEATLQLLAGETVFKDLQNLSGQTPVEDIHQLVQRIHIIEAMGLAPNYWKAQNHYLFLFKQWRNGELAFPSGKWEAAFRKLGEQLRINTDFPTRTESTLQDRGGLLQSGQSTSYSKPAKP
jgi:alpha-amylase/alpha-mannosidase (GH57 family)